MVNWTALDAAQEFRDHGVFKPVTIAQDMTVLTGLTVITALIYFSLTRTRETSKRHARVVFITCPLRQAISFVHAQFGMHN